MIGVLPLMAIFWLSAEPAAAQSTACADLRSKSFGDQVTIQSAALVAATEALPEHCDVRATIWPEVKFALKLPAGWNERFYMVGNGGTAGVISFEAMDVGVRKGFAAASTDTGHDAEKEPMAVFGRPGPDNPHAKQKIIDFGYRSVHETTVVAKRIIAAYYGRGPRYSYWVGCSTGGRQGLSEAQRYPEDFDGLVVGAPVVDLIGTNLRHAWNALVQAGSASVPPAKLPQLAAAVYGKCDRTDGVEDGLIEDPRACAFDPTADLRRCPAGTDGAECFTSGQVEALAKIYGGVRNSTGTRIFPGQPLGAEAMVDVRGRDGASVSRSGWTDVISFADGQPRSAAVRAESYMKWMFLDSAPDEEFTLSKLNFDRDPARMNKAGETLNATNPDLQALKQRGGKIIHYHGWADPAVTPLMSIEYYESVLTQMGAASTRDFYRMYLVPGMFHCGGGPGCDTVDWLSAIMGWVEQGKAPEAVIGARLENGTPVRTRPLCPYPQVAKYKGSGSIDEAQNFTCVPAGKPSH
jgi:feruloyl esterase